MKLGVVVALVFTCVGAIEAATSLPHAAQDEDEYTAYADDVVREWITREIDRSNRIAQSADAAAKAAKDAWYKAKSRPKTPRPTRGYGHEEVERLRKSLKTLEGEKKQAEREKGKAHKKRQDANKREEEMARRLAEAKQRAMSAKKIAEARSEEATTARTAANTAAARAQESQTTDFIPEGFEQTQVILVGEARRLAEEAEFAELMARRAMSEAKQLDDAMVEVARQATAVWLEASKAGEEYTVKDGIYKAKSEAHANTKAAYDKAVKAYEASKSTHDPSRKTVEQTERDYHQKVSLAAKYWAVNRAFRALYRCAGLRPATNRGRSPGRSSEESRRRDGSSEERPRPTRTRGANRAGSSEEARRASRNRAGNRSRSSEEARRASRNRSRNRVGSSEEARRASRNRAANRDGSSEERRASRNRAPNRRGSSEGRGATRSRTYAGHKNANRVYYYGPNGRLLTMPANPHRTHGTYNRPRYQPNYRPSASYYRHGGGSSEGD